MINLKDELDRVKEYIEKGMAFPAYHMNKKHWYTLFMDDSLTDEVIIDLIRRSHALVS